MRVGCRPRPESRAPEPGHSRTGLTWQNWDIPRVLPAAVRDAGLVRGRHACRDTPRRAPGDYSEQDAGGEIGSDRVRVYAIGGVEREGRVRSPHRFRGLSRRRDGALRRRRDLLIHGSHPAQIRRPTACGRRDVQHEAGAYPAPRVRKSPNHRTGPLGMLHRSLALLLKYQEVPGPSLQQGTPDPLPRDIHHGRGQNRI